MKLSEMRSKYHRTLDWLNVNYDGSDLSRHEVKVRPDGAVICKTFAPGRPIDSSTISFEIVANEVHVLDNRNQITQNLRWLPKDVEHVSLSNFILDNFEGMPRHVKHVFIRNSTINSFKGASKEVEDIFGLTECHVLSVEGFCREVGDAVRFRHVWFKAGAFHPHNVCTTRSAWIDTCTYDENAIQDSEYSKRIGLLGWFNTDSFNVRY